MSRFCSSGETYAKVAEAKKANVNNSLAQHRTLQWWTSDDEVAFQAHLKASGYNSEDDEEDEKLLVTDLTIRDDDDKDNTTNNKKKNKRQQSLDPPKKRESTSSNKNRSKSLDAGSRNSKCYLGIPHTFEDEDVEYINYCVEEGIDGARKKFVWNEVMFRCKHCSKPAISMERVQNPDRDIKYYPDHCGKCALEHISKEYIIERAATCGCNRERYHTYLNCYACVYYTNRMGKLCGLVMNDGVRVGCGKEITSDNTMRITTAKLCDGCLEQYKVLSGMKQMTHCKLCGYLLPISTDKRCEGSRMRCPNKYAGRDGNTKCSDLCQNVSC
jgi:hypothetical protein